MGLWGSKQQTKEFTTTNPTKPVDSSEIYITQSALDSVLNTADNSSSAGKPLPQKSSDKEANVDSDKRVKEYEEKMLRNLNVSTRNVEDLFNDRYQHQPICEDLQKSVSSCYKDHPSAPLNCLNLANQFIKCVEKERQKQLGNTFMKPV